MNNQEALLRLADVKAICDAVHLDDDGARLRDPDQAGSIFSALDYALRGSPGCVDLDEWQARRIVALVEHGQYLEPDGSPEVTDEAPKGPPPRVVVYWRGDEDGYEHGQALTPEASAQMPQGVVGVPGGWRLAEYVLAEPWSRGPVLAGVSDKYGQVRVEKVGNTGFDDPNEPVALFRAQDKHALPALTYYLEQLQDDPDVPPEQLASVTTQVRRFRYWSRANPEKIRTPGTSQESNASPEIRTAPLPAHLDDVALNDAPEPVTRTWPDDLPPEGCAP